MVGVQTESDRSTTSNERHNLTVIVVVVIVVVIIIVVVDVGEEVDPCVGHDQHEAHVADGVEGASRPGGPGLVVDLLLKHHDEWPGLRLGSR